MYERVDVVPGHPDRGKVLLRRIRVAFEHEHSLDENLVKEVSHLILIHCDLRVLVTYPHVKERNEGAILDQLHSLVSETDCATSLAELGQLMIILGDLEPADPTQVNWRGLVYRLDGWKLQHSRYT
jgi:hypothetical protein